MDLPADYVEILRDFSAPNGEMSASGAKELWLYVKSVASVHRRRAVDFITSASGWQGNSRGQVLFLKPRLMERTYKSDGNIVRLEPLPQSVAPRMHRFTTL